MVNQEGLGVVYDDVIAVFSNDTELLHRFILSQNTVCEGYVHKFWRKFKMHHFDWEVLSSSIMDGDTAVLAGADQEFASVVVFDGSERLIELRERVNHLSCVDVKDPHGSGVETTSED